MSFTWTFSKVFAREFKNLPKADQNKILAFLDTYETDGLADFGLYPGKLAPSWSGENISVFNHDYAKRHDLWHYHVGVPSYSSKHSKYFTSDYLLHFQWPQKGDHIHIVDMYSHYTSDGGFYLPPETYLK